ncbi:MAG: DUF2239 family protein [Hyphomicrobium sp.]
MDQQRDIVCSAFCGEDRIACGALRHVALKAKAIWERGEPQPIFIWENATGGLIDIDLSGTDAEVLTRARERQSQQAQGACPNQAGQTKPRAPGRPKLGVVGREVTLLPRHWEWLRTQPGGASVALRKLVEQARLANADKDRNRQSQQAAYRFLSFMGGDRLGFEEASRALFRGERESFEAMIADWPADIRDFAQQLAAPGFQADPAATAGAVEG